MTQVKSGTESKTVSLGDLEHDPIAIEGHEHRLTQLDDLLASIPIKGQLQSLKVRPSPLSALHSEYWVTAGNRRLATLRQLQKTGGSIQGVKVTDDYPVHVIISNETDSDAYASSRAENLQRLPESVVEEVRGFAKMAKTMPAKEIAAQFGCTVKRVEQRLKLALLHDEVLTALDKGKITIEAAQAFTLEPDPEKQAKYLKKASTWELGAETIKRAFTQKLVRGDSPAAKLIGAKAYVAAGGQVLGDLFDDKSYWISQDVLDRLLVAHWEKQKAAWIEEGWAFVESSDEFAAGDSWKIYQSVVLKPGEDGVFTAEQKASAGVVYWLDGGTEPRVGIQRWKSRQEHEEEEDEPDLNYPGGQVVKTLIDAVSNGVKAKVAEDALLALRVLIAALRHNGAEWGNNPPIDIMREFSLEQDGENGDAEVLFADVLTAIEGWDTEQLLGELALIVAAGVEMGQHNSGRQGEVALLKLAKPAIAFDAGAYFNALTKPLLDLAWRDMTDPNSGEKPPKGKIADIVAKVMTRAEDTGWLPPQLRTPAYAGPRFVTAIEAEETAESEDDEQLQAAE